MGKALDFCQNSPHILFRLLHDGGPSIPPTSNFRETGDLLSCDPSRPFNLPTVDAHLSWTNIDTPYVSFCNGQKARRWLDFLRERGVSNITLVAIDTSGMTIILDAGTKLPVKYFAIAMMGWIIASSFEIIVANI